MTDFENILPLWSELERAGADYVLATIVAVEGPSYRKNPVRACSWPLMVGAPAPLAADALKQKQPGARGGSLSPVPRSNATLGRYAGRWRDSLRLRLRWRNHIPASERRVTAFAPLLTALHTAFRAQDSPGDCHRAAGPPHRPQSILRPSGGSGVRTDSESCLAQDLGPSQSG